MKLSRAGFWVMCSIFTVGVLGGFGLPEWVRGAASTTQDFTASFEVILSDTPNVSQVILNHGNPIILIPGATTTVEVNFTVQDGAGCEDVFASGTVNTVVFRSSLGGSCQQSDLNCYTTSTLVHSCSQGSTSTAATATATVSIYYFADATDASSSYETDDWKAQVTAADDESNTGEASSTAVELNTMLAIDLDKYSIDYGGLVKGTDTGTDNQSTTISNAGNCKLNIEVGGTAMTSGGDSIATSSQHYAISPFDFGVGDNQLSDAAQIITNFLLTTLGNSNGSGLLGWSYDDALPSTLINHSMASHNGYVYVTGGYTAGAGTSTILYSQVGQDGTLGAWQNASLPHPAYYHASVAENGYLYLTGGQTTGGAYTSSVKYAPINATGSLGQWQSANPYPSTISAHAAVAENGYLYVIGGTNGTPTSGIAYAEIHATGSLGQWMSAGSMPTTRYDHTVAAYNGYLYVIGGLAFTSTVLYAPINATGSLGNWNATSAPHPTSYNSAVVQGDSLYVVGGRVSGTSVTSSVIYSKINPDASLEQWYFATSMPYSNYQHSAVGSNGYLYVTGGTASGTATSTVIEAKFDSDPVSSTVYWGASVPGNAPAGNYSSFITYTAVYAP